MVLLDERDRVFLLKVHYPWVVDVADVDLPGPAWITPGGGVEDGETHKMAAIRELEEETGLADVQLLGWIWSREREHLIRGLAVLGRERFFMVRVKNPSLSFDGQTDVERETLIDTRWWRLDEIAVSEDLFVPRNLAELLKPILDGSLPTTPIPIGR